MSADASGISGARAGAWRRVGGDVGRDEEVDDKDREEAPLDAVAEGLLPAEVPTT